MQKQVKFSLVFAPSQVQKQVQKQEKSVQKLKKIGAKTGKIGAKTDDNFTGFCTDLLALLHRWVCKQN